MQIIISWWIDQANFAKHKNLVHFNLINLHIINFKAVHKKLNIHKEFDNFYLLSCIITKIFLLFIFKYLINF